MTDIGLTIVKYVSGPEKKKFVDKALPLLVTYYSNRTKKCNKLWDMLNHKFEEKKYVFVARWHVVELIIFVLASCKI